MEIVPFKSRESFFFGSVYIILKLYRWTQILVLPFLKAIEDDGRSVAQIIGSFPSKGKNCSGDGRKCW